MKEITKIKTTIRIESKWQCARDCSYCRYDVRYGCEPRYNTYELRCKLYDWSLEDTGYSVKRLEECVEEFGYKKNKK